MDTPYITHDKSSLPCSLHHVIMHTYAIVIAPNFSRLSRSFYQHSVKFSFNGSKQLIRVEDAGGTRRKSERGARLFIGMINQQLKRVHGDQLALDVIRWLGQNPCNNDESVRSRSDGMADCLLLINSLPMRRPMNHSIGNRGDSIKLIGLCLYSSTRIYSSSFLGPINAFIPNPTIFLLSIEYPSRQPDICLKYEISIYNLLGKQFMYTLASLFW